MPSPSYPLLHLHSKLFSVSVQKAKSEHGLSEHLISDNKNSKLLRKFKNSSKNTEVLILV